MSSSGRSPAPGDGPQLQWVESTRIQTRLQGLRGARKPSSTITQQLCPMPLRVVGNADGDYELVDGFKRLARWRQLGLKQVPVMVERLRSSVELKVALLEANRPPRTLSPMDEARVVKDLRRTEHLGPATIAKVCGRKRRWVLQRLTLAEQLCEPLQHRLDAGSLGVTLAHALCALTDEQQQAVAGAVEQHRLKGQEALSLLSAYRVAESPAEQRQLLNAPLEVVRPKARSASPMGALATRLEARLDRVRDALQAIADFQLPDAGLTPAERRRLEAGHQAALLQLMQTAQKLAAEHLGIIPQKDNDHDDLETETEHLEPRNRFATNSDGDARANTDANAKTDARANTDGQRHGDAHTDRDAGGGTDTSAKKRQEEQPGENEENGRAHGRATRRHQTALRDEVRHPQDRPQARPRPQAGAQRAGQAGTARDAGVAAQDRRLRAREQARSLPGPDRGEGAKEAVHLAHPAGGYSQGVPGRAHHPGRLRPDLASPTAAEEEGVATLRDPAR